MFSLSSTGFSNSNQEQVKCTKIVNMKVYQEEKGRERMMVKKYTVGYQMGIFVANLIFDDKKNPKS